MRSTPNQRLAIPSAAIILALAFAIRLAAAFAFPNVIAADEVFQFLEQAHRLVFGTGVVPWEFQVGLRNWTIPLLLAIPMGLTRLLTPDPLAGLAVIRILLCAASLPTVWCATKWGQQAAGRPGAWLAGLFTACWPDLWLMAPHPLEEVLAADLLVPAVYLVGTRQTPGRIAATGALLGLIFVLRMQLAPAIAIIGIALCRRDPARWRLALLAACLPVLAAGMLDWFSWGTPFRSFYLNLYLNLSLHIAKDDFGTYSGNFFPFWLSMDWLWTMPFIGLLAWRGAKQRPIAGITVLVILLLHSVIAHKEFRFIYPAVAVAVPLAGVGLASLAANLPKPRQAMLLTGLLTGPCASPLLAMQLYSQTSAFTLFRALAAQKPCLVSLQGWTPAFLPLPPLFGPETRFTSQTINQTGPSIIEADAMVGTAGLTAIPSGFTLQTCVPGPWIPFNAKRPELCLWRRPAASCLAGPVAPFTIIFPVAAKPFIIPDRLAG